LCLHTALIESTTSKSVNFEIHHRIRYTSVIPIPEIFYLCTLHCDSLHAWSHISSYHTVGYFALHKLLVHICEPYLYGFLFDKLNASFIPHLLSHIRRSFKSPIHPLSRRHPCPFRCCGDKKAGVFFFLNI
jgi:hypothetical protein